MIPAGFYIATHSFRHISRHFGGGASVLLGEKVDTNICKNLFYLYEKVRNNLAKKVNLNCFSMKLFHKYLKKQTKKITLLLSKSLRRVL